MRKLLAIGFIVLLLLVLLVGLSTKHNLAANTDITVAPDVATIILDGKTHVKVGNQYISPGKHILSVSMAGFATYKTTIQIRTIKNNTVSLVLTPNSQVGYDYLLQHPSEELKREALGGKAFVTNSKNTSKQNPLITSLPFIDQFFRIDYGKSVAHPNDPNAVAYYITYYSDDGKQQALNWITFKGYDPSTLEIIYQSQVPD